MTLEEQARQAWKSWGSYAMFTICDACGVHKHCRAVRRSYWLCLDCWDQRQGRRR